MIIVNDRFFVGIIIATVYIVMMYVFWVCRIPEQRKTSIVISGIIKILICGGLVALILNLLLFFILDFIYGTIIVFSKPYEQISFFALVSLGGFALYSILTHKCPCPTTDRRPENAGRDAETGTKMNEDFEEQSTEKGEKEK